MRRLFGPPLYSYFDIIGRYYALDFSREILISLYIIVSNEFL